jgi:nucleoside-diphosphate-sugar epimerase
VKYASIRPVYILGPKNYAARESFIYSRLLQAKEITLPGNGQALAQFVFADEVADSLVRILEKKADGAFNCCGDDLVTLEGLVELMAGVCDRKAKTRSNPKTDGDKFDGSEFPFANENMICSNSRIKSLGIVFRGLGDGLEQDYLSHYGPILNGK